MRKTLLLLIMFLSILNGFSQVVNSSCTAPDSVLQQYSSDADRLTLRNLFEATSTYTDSVFIPQPVSDSILSALVAVYNAVSIPQRDTVVLTHNIHTLPDHSLTVIKIYADSTLFWMQQLRLGNLITGEPDIDSIISNYGLNIQNYDPYFNLFSYHFVTFSSDSNLNMRALANLFMQIGVGADPTPFYIDGNDITDSITSDFIQLVYSYGWEDCPSGCLCKRYWKFRVYYDCSVEFIESYGCHVSLTAIDENTHANSFFISPNPTSSQTTIHYTISDDLSHQKAKLKIIDELGNEVHAITLNPKNNSIVIGKGNLQTGIYFITLTIADKKVKTEKLVVL